MKQIIEHDGQSDGGIDRYVIDGSRGGRNLTRESVAYIRQTMRRGEPDVVQDGRHYRIIHLERGTPTGSDQWTSHIEIMGSPVHDYLAEIGCKGGQAKSPAKARASVANGAKGGRPRKIVG